VTLFQTLIGIFVPKTTRFFLGEPGKLPRTLFERNKNCLKKGLNTPPNTSFQFPTVRCKKISRKMQENKSHDTSLAEQETLYRGHCYCGTVHYTVSKSTEPFTALYCHCESCRRAHSAPLYHVVYVPKNDFNITRGHASVNAFTKPDAAVTRAFCNICGSRLYNTLARDENWWGFFPATLEEALQHDLPAQFRPKGHNLPEEAVLDTARLECAAR